MFKRNKILSKALFGLSGFIFISTFFTPAQSELYGQSNSNEARAAQQKAFVLCKLDYKKAKKDQKKQLEYLVMLFVSLIRVIFLLKEGIYIWQIN